MNHILVVDDEPLMRTWLSKSIPKHSTCFDVPNTARDGIEAVEYLKQAAYDVVITDIKMPGMDGLSLAKFIQENYPDTVVIIISGFNDFAYARKAIQYGVKDYLLKPGMKEEMEAALNHVADELNTLKRKNKQEEDLNDPLSGELKRIRKGMDGYSLVVSGALKRIEHDMDKNISLGDMAGEFLISPGHFSKCFKRETGVGFASYVTMVKMEKARELLKDPQNRVGEVARMLGYSDYAYFFQVFKKQFGYAPREIKAGDKKEGKGGD